MKHNFRFSGTGGQGLITAGIILAEAAILDGKEAIQSQSYGPEARGGSSKAPKRKPSFPTTRFILAGLPARTFCWL